MIKKYFEYIVVVLLLTLIIGVVIAIASFSYYQGISPEEEAYRLEIHDLHQEKAELVIKDQQKDETIKEFIAQFDSIKNSSAIDTATVSELNDLFATYLNKRR